MVKQIALSIKITIIIKISINISIITGKTFSK